MYSLIKSFDKLRTNGELLIAVADLTLHKVRAKAIGR